MYIKSELFLSQLLIFAIALIFSGCSKKLNKNVSVKTSEDKSLPREQLVDMVNDPSSSTRTKPNNAAGPGIEPFLVNKKEILATIEMGSSVSITDIQLHIDHFEQDVLLEIAKKYSEMINTQNGKLQILQNEFSELTYDDKLRKKGIVLERKIGSCSKVLKALSNRYDIYYSSLKNENASILKSEVKRIEAKPEFAKNLL